MTEHDKGLGRAKKLCLALSKITSNILLYLQIDTRGLVFGRVFGTSIKKEEKKESKISAINSDCAVTSVSSHYLTFPLL